MSIKRIENQDRTKMFIDSFINPRKNYDDIISGKYLTFFAEIDYKHRFPNAVCEILGIKSDCNDRINRYNIECYATAQHELVAKLPRLKYLPRLTNDPKFINHLRKADLQNINNWMYSERSVRNVGGKDRKKSGGKDTIYRLCLGLFRENDSIERTYEFFLKACMFPPFNPKRVIDVVFYYCIKHHKTIDDAYKIIDDIDMENIKQQSSSETIGLSNKMQEIFDKGSLIKYIEAHCCRDNQLGYSKALNKINDLTNRLKSEKIKTQFKSSEPLMCSKVDKHFGENKLTSVNRDNKKGKFDQAVKGIESILRSEFKFDGSAIECVRAVLDDIIDTFPVYQSNGPLQKCDGDRTELIRRTLMVRSLAYYFIKPINSSNPETIYNDCITQVDSSLLECGFMQTYPFNPFDLLILICASKGAYDVSEHLESATPLYEVVNNLFAEVTDHLFSQKPRFQKTSPSFKA